MEKTIKISDKMWKKLNKIKYDYGYKNIDEIISKMFKIINKIKTAEEILKGEENDKNKI